MSDYSVESLLENPILFSIKLNSFVMILVEIKLKTSYSAQISHQASAIYLFNSADLFTERVTEVLSES